MFENKGLISYLGLREIKLQENRESYIINAELHALQGRLANKGQIGQAYPKNLY